MHWMIDGRVDLDVIMDDAGQHLRSVIDLLMGAGLDATDADAYARFVFADRAHPALREAPPEDHVTDAQYARLSAAE